MRPACCSTESAKRSCSTRAMSFRSVFADHACGGLSTACPLSPAAPGSGAERRA